MEGHPYRDRAVAHRGERTVTTSNPRTQRALRRIELWRSWNRPNRQAQGAGHFLQTQRASVGLAAREHSAALFRDTQSGGVCDQVVSCPANLRNMHRQDALMSPAMLPVHALHLPFQPHLEQDGRSNAKLEPAAPRLLGTHVCVEAAGRLGDRAELLPSRPVRLYRQGLEAHHAIACPEVRRLPTNLQRLCSYLGPQAVIGLLRDMLL